VCPKEGYMVCSGKCPAGCYCADGWGIYVDVDTDTPEGSDTNPTGLSLAVADQAPDPAARNSATAFAKYAATAEWSILPFVTLFTHTEDVANSRKRSSSREVYGLVDLCKTTAEGAEIPVEFRAPASPSDASRTEMHLKSNSLGARTTRRAMP
jgi:hypothetical protein